MKKNLSLIGISTAMMLSSLSSNAATGWGDGCNTTQHEAVSYVYVADNVIFALIDNQACFVTDIGDQAIASGAASILSEAMTSGKNAKLFFNATSVQVSMSN